MTEFLNNFESAILKNGSAHCFVKNIECTKTNDDGIATVTNTRMIGITKNGTISSKYITVNDEENRTAEEINVSQDPMKVYHFTGCNLTGYRCSEMTAIAIEMLYGMPKMVGFIGTGKTNLLNCIAIKGYFGIDDIVIRGSKRNFAKNAGDFMTVCSNVEIDTSEDMRILNKCDVVVTCTSSCNKDEQISASTLYGPTLIVALDGGYYLDESFRSERVSFTDWKEQTDDHYEYVFAFDKSKYFIHQMRHDHAPYDKAVAYVEGVSIADAVAAERIIKTLEKSEMGKPFLV